MKKEIVERDLLPREFRNVNEETILKRMLDRAPKTIDKSEGHMLHDHLVPVSYALNDTVNFHVSEALRVVFPQYATGEYLELHGNPIGLERRDGTPSSGILTIEGEVNTEVPAGTLFWTTPVDEDEAIMFELLEDVVIGSKGTVEAPIRALENGRHTNVSQLTISGSKFKGITRVYNDETFTGGSDIESDDSYRIRILDRLQLRPASGNVADYIQWAREVPGVGNEVIVRRTPKGPKTVKVLIVDSEGNMASDELVESVQEYIDPKPGEGLGQAPIGAHVDVVTVRHYKLNLNIELERSETCDFTLMIQSIEETVNEYAKGRSVIRYNSLIGLLVNITCIKDIINMTINGDTKDIHLEHEDELGILGELIINGQKIERSDY